MRTSERHDVDMTARGEFYEDDEPVEEVLAAFERGTKHLTARPPLATMHTGTGKTENFVLAQAQSEPISDLGSTEPYGHLISH